MPQLTTPGRTPHITPCLWFDDDLEEAAAYYASVFPDSTPLTSISRYTAASPGETGTVMAGDFTIAGQRFRGINGGPLFPFTEAVSFSIDCADQAEVDHYWEALLDGGEESQCGWLKDRFGVSWQVVPDRLHELVADPDPDRAAAAIAAMMGMRRIVVADLEAAADAVTTARA